MEARGAAAPAFPVKSRKGKIEWKDVSQRYGLVKDVGGGEGGAGADCSVTRDIGLIKLSGEIHIRQGDSREDIGEETQEHLAASPPNPDVRGEGS